MFQQCMPVDGSGGTKGNHTARCLADAVRYQHACPDWSTELACAYSLATNNVITLT